MVTQPSTEIQQITSFRSLNGMQLPARNQMFTAVYTWLNVEADQLFGCL
jgi:hypothetical protein